ncbi:dephospho-CoA kinase [Magnetospirillum sp. UT-4]|uniref:dephospho-CoA kinase n=1 Tax=Magnetospirillum sp. UT-4 TaxID=2681467 RepID=UPI00137D2925|nr:dephospho-CoA kinase [Magnetospirillum sp. UT-4]CAA7621934.1 Dephospho-CoA kinase [Magnetospirillum sp. UT-4]
MRVLGLTGSIGMGKSWAAAELRRMRIPVHDSDAVVHALLGPGGAAVAPVAAAFPGSVRDGAVDRAALGRLVFGDAAALRRLEAIVHPLVRAAEAAFRRRQRRRRARLVALDVPLLFETGGERRCHRVAVVSCPAFLQAERVLKRPGMTMERLRAIRAKQMPDAEKRRRADFVVATGLGRAFALRALKRAVRLTRDSAGR